MEIVHKVSAEVMCAYNPRSKKLWRGEEKIVNQVRETGKSQDMVFGVGEIQG